MDNRINLNKEELRKKLTPEQFEVTQNNGTEAPFSGEYTDNKDIGIYHCVVCSTELFSSDTKYDSKSGWPSFYDKIDKDAVTEKKDISLGMERTEVVCNKCGAHLGHVFPDGPNPTGNRYCINSVSLDFKKND